MQSNSNDGKQKDAILRQDEMSINEKWDCLVYSVTENWKVLKAIDKF